jgi:hypothetical protein
LLVEEYGAAFKNLPGHKIAEGFANSVSRLNIDDLNIHQQQQKNHKHFSQDKKTTASVMSYHHSQCILS